MESKPKTKNPFKNDTNFKNNFNNFNNYKTKHKNNKFNFRNKNSPLRKKEKFVPENAVETSTPWHELKEGLLEKSEKKNTNAQGIDIQSQKQNERIRQENYKKFVINEKQTEPVTWERFSPEPNNSKLTKGKQKMKNELSKSKKEKILKTKLEHNTERFVKNAILTPRENDFLRKVITKTTIVSRTFSLHSAVNSMKTNGVFSASRKKVLQIPKKKRD